MSSPSMNRDNPLRDGSHRVRKPRGKYSSRACVQCRKRKLKCSGNEPCHRCSRSRLPCLFSDDPVLIAEFLRRSYPLGSPNQGVAVAQVPLSQHDEGTPHATPRDSENHDARPDLTDRLKKVESTLDAIVKLMQQNQTRDSVEPQLPDEDDGYQGDTAFKAPVSTFNANLASLREKLGHQDPPSPPNADNRSAGQSSHPSVADPRSADRITTVRLGSQDFPFPAPPEYLRYHSFFFDDINPCHPCVNEADFDAKCERIRETRVASPQDVSILALNFIIFACTDILTDISPAQEKGRLPGWRWYKPADKLMHKRKINGRVDLTLIQYLVYECLYLTYADKANAAYNTAGLACRLCFQHGLHQQRLWGNNCTPFSTHMRQRLFWTVYFLDRRISLSCGRPYGMRDSDINVDLPEWIDDKALDPDQPLPETNLENNYNAYLSCMAAFARFAGEIWDQAFSATAVDTQDLGEKIAVLDTRIRYWLDTTLPSTPLIPQQSTPTARHLWQFSLVRTRMNHLRLLLRRRTMVSLTYGATDGLVCGGVAMDIVRDIHSHAREAEKPSSYRFHMAFSLGGAIIVLAALLCRDLTAIGLHKHRPEYAESYHLGMSTLRDLATNLCEAGRILDNLKDITNVVDLVLQHRSPDALGTEDFTSLVPANMNDLFPYSGMDYFNVDLTPSDLGQLCPATSEARLETELTSGATQDYHDNFGASWDLWDQYELLRTTGEQGVPWV